VREGSLSLRSLSTVGLHKQCAVEFLCTHSASQQQNVCSGLGRRREKELSSDLCIIRQTERLLPPQKPTLSIFFLWSIVGNLLSDCACAGGVKGLGGVLICKMRYQQAAVEGENGERDGKFLFLLRVQFLCYVGISITADSLMTLRYRVSPICRCGERESNFFLECYLQKLSIYRAAFAGAQSALHSNRQ
jgi:hypothetical protein